MSARQTAKKTGKEAAGAASGKKASSSAPSGAEWIGAKRDQTLGRYFRELADHEVLSSEDEAEAARCIADLEIGLWRTLLGDPAVAGRHLARLRELIDADPAYAEAGAVRDLLAALRRRKLKAKSPRARASIEKTLDLLADALYEADLKRELVGACVDEVRRYRRENRSTAQLREYDATVRRAMGQVKVAKHGFIQANLRLVVAIARRYDRGQMPLIDLIQEGNLGLIKAVDRFDYRRGFRFSTYASWWIRHAIGRALADKGHTVRVPVHALDTQHRVARAREAIKGRLGRPPTDEELAEETGLDRRRLDKARKHAVSLVASLDRNIAEGDDRRYVDLVADENAKSPFESAMLRSWTEEMGDVLEVLTPIERTILRWRYGLDGAEEMTLKQIGDHYNLSRERIRQLQQQALGKIRRKLSTDAA